MAYAYDAAGRRTGIEWPDGFAATYGRDLSGHRVGGADSVRRKRHARLAYAYNDLGLVTGDQPGSAAAAHRSSAGYGTPTSGQS